LLAEDATVSPAGARIIKKAQKIFWDGYSGYFADPDGYPNQIPNYLSLS
jgi:uncharacterized glyoxalase superfamily protein PhnB